MTVSRDRRPLCIACNEPCDASGIDGLDRDPDEGESVCIARRSGIVYWSVHRVPLDPTQREALEDLYAASKTFAMEWGGGSTVVEQRWDAAVQRARLVME